MDEVHTVDVERVISCRNDAGSRLHVQYFIDMGRVTPGTKS